MNCSRCGKELSEDQTYAYEGKAFCEDCLMKVGLNSKECEPWSTYLKTKEMTEKPTTE